MDRRNFLKTGAVAVGLAEASDLLGHTTPSSPIPKRTLGKTGEQLSILGFGGTAVMSIPQSEANSAVAEAFDHGVNYYDVSPTYRDAEDRLVRHWNRIGIVASSRQKPTFVAKPRRKRD